MSGESSSRPSRGDRIGIWVFIVAGAAIVAVTVAGAVIRLVEVLGPGPVPVPVTFTAGTSATLRDGHPVAVDSGTVMVDHLPSAAVVPAVLAQVVLMATVTAVVICLILLARRTLRGRIFGRTSTRLATTAGIVGLVGSGVAPAFEGATAQAALAHAAIDPQAVAVLTVSPFPFVIGAFAVAIVLTAYAVGARLERETEGLV